MGSSKINRENMHRIWYSLAPIDCRHKQIFEEESNKFQWQELFLFSSHQEKRTCFDWHEIRL